MKIFSSFLILVFSIIYSESFAIDNIKKDKKTIINSIESQKERLIEISDKIWEAAEPALLELSLIHI